MNTKTYTTLPQEAKDIRIEVFMKEQGFENEFDDIDQISSHIVSIPWWRSHPIHENRTTESIWTEPCNPLLRATKSTKRATSIYEITLIFYLIFE